MKLQKVKWWYIVILLFPAILTFSLRGNVGTDTYIYLVFLENTSSNSSFYSEGYTRFEPGFEFLGMLLGLLGLSPRMSLATIGMITTIILCKAYSVTKRQLLLFTIVVFPLFFYDITMNGIRYGLSFSLATLAIDSLYRKKYKFTALWGSLAFSMQFSSALVLFPFITALIRKKYLILLVSIFILIGLMFPASFSFLTERIAGKQNAYANVFAPSIFSGLAPLVMVFIMYVNYLIFYNKNSYNKIIHFIFLFEVLSFIFSKYSYAGLRFQGAFMYCMIVYLKNNIEYISAYQFKKYFLGLLLINIIGILIFIKNISGSVPGDLSPFLPYRFFWQEQRWFTA